MEDLKCIAADLVNGQSLKLPGNFFMTNLSKKFIETNDIIEKLFANQKKNMRGLRVFVYSY